MVAHSRLRARDRCLLIHVRALSWAGSCASRTSHRIGDRRAFSLARASQHSRDQGTRGRANHGCWHWNPTNLTRGAPGGSVWGILNGMAATFIAFEGFEMIAYDHRELRAPKRIMGKGLAAAVIAVGLAYALVTVGAASLVGADVLIKQKENALAVAGQKAAGNIGLIFVTVAACFSAASAVNATLFSVSRLARSSAERRLMPGIFARC